MNFNHIFSLNIFLQYCVNICLEGLCRWLSGKKFACECRRLGFSPWVGKIPWRRKWQPSPVLLPGESHGQRSLVGYSPWGHTESDTTEVTKQEQQQWLWCWPLSSCAYWPFIYLLFWSVLSDISPSPPFCRAEVEVLVFCNCVVQACYIFQI